MLISKAEMIRYPLILLDYEYSQKDQIVIVIAKPTISFSRSRFQSNLGLVNMKFCDSNGTVFVLSGIDLIRRDYNPIHLLLNKCRFQRYGTYRFNVTNDQLTLDELKHKAIELMKYETVEESWKDYSNAINVSKDFEEVIGQFGYGVQT